MTDFYEVIARHTVRRNPSGRTEATGEFDADGEPIIRTVPDVHPAGSTFEIEDEGELFALLDSGAVELVDDDYQPRPAKPEKAKATEANNWSDLL